MYTLTSSKAGGSISSHTRMFRIVSLFHRLKMGVCEGSPASIMPDHMGRADYHGACIIQAARIMDAGINNALVRGGDVMV